jgi:hypothetical protein
MLFVAAFIGLLGVLITMLVASSHSKRERQAVIKSEFESIPRGVLWSYYDNEERNLGLIEFNGREFIVHPSAAVSPQDVRLNSLRYMSSAKFWELVATGHLFQVLPPPGAS